MRAKGTHPTIVRKEVDDSHYYWVNDHYAPGVTTILEQAAPVASQLKDYFIKNSVEEISRKSRESLELGSRVHDVATHLLQGDEINLENYETNLGVSYPRSFREKKMISSFYNWFVDIDPTNYLSEHTVASLDPLYAGTVDFSGWLNSKKVGDFLTGAKAHKFKAIKEEEFWIVDWKTSAGIYFNYKLQLKAYQKAYEEMYGKKVDHVAIVRLGTKNKRGYEFEEVRDEDVNFEDFKRIYDTFLKINGGKIPDPPIVDVFPKTLKIKTEGKISEEVRT